MAFNAEDYTTVIEMSNKSLGYDSEFSDPYYYMARIYNKDLEYDKALENAQKALDYETDEEKKPRIWFELGNAYVGIVEYEKACEAFSHCLVEPFESTVRHKMENVLNCQ
jgi:tetratricopeptide (TPR) repeat protein